MTEPTDALFVVNEAERIVRGRLLPFGELSRPSVTSDPIMFAADAIDVPADAEVVTLNRDHDRFGPIGRALKVEKAASGIEADFRIARTPEGDAALADIKAGRVKALSAEVTGLVRQGSNAVRSKLTGAALVPVGAFEGAALFAALDEVTDETPAEELPEDVLDAIERIVTERLDGVRADPDPDPDTDPDQAPAASDTPNKEDDMTAGAATIPAGLAPAPAKKDETSADGLFAAIAASRQGNAAALAPYAGGDALFAISPLQHSGPSTVTIGADVQQPAYLGQLWKRRKYQRRFVPLLGHSALTSYRAVGWQWDDGKEPVVGDYTGNTAEVPSNALDTKQVTMDAQRIAGGHKLDRRYIDFNDQGVIASYHDHMVEDVARKTDAKALAAIIAAATATTAGTVPAGVADGLAAIVDGALDIIATENTPSFAIVDPALWRDIMLTGKDDTFAFLNAGFGLEEGSLEGFKIVPGGTKGSGLVYVGAREALTFYELGGEAPIRVEGIDPHHGAIDPAVFAYWATIVNNAAAIRVVDTDPA